MSEGDFNTRHEAAPRPGRYGVAGGKGGHRQVRLLLVLIGVLFALQLLAILLVYQPILDILAERQSLRAALVASGAVTLITTALGAVAMYLWLRWPLASLVVAAQDLARTVQTDQSAATNHGRQLHRSTVALQQLAYIAHHDPLTGLANRVLLQERIGAAISRHDRYGGTFAVMCCDIDGFSGVNESSSRAGGDELLQIVGEMLACSVRPSDLVARVQADRFVILLEEIDTHRANEVACKVADMFDVPVPISSGPVAVGLSWGIAMYPDSGHSPLQLLAAAEAEVASAKARRVRNPVAASAAVLEALTAGTQQASSIASLRRREGARTTPKGQARRATRTRH
jgi:diguanylate cyclase (GGDEF)-like protein